MEAWPQASARERQHYERSRWLIRLLYHTALRASEAANAQAADFFQRRGRWWLHVIGKGGAEGEVPVSDTLMADFARYRAFHDLAPMPLPAESTPAVMSIAGDAKGHLTPTAIYLIAKEVFRRAADTLEPTDPIGAATLRRASTHWLRHYVSFLTMSCNPPIARILRGECWNGKEIVFIPTAASWLRGRSASLVSSFISGRSLTTE